MNKILDKLTDHFEDNRKYSYEAIDIAYDTAQEDAFLMCLKHGRFELEYGEKGMASRYYSERYGNLRAYPCTFNEDGSAVLITEKGYPLEFGADMFKTVRVLVGEVPCMVPGGIELIKEVLSEQQADSTEKDHK